MMAVAVDEFGIWLSEKLKALNTDENVFGAYISGILDGDDSGEEKKEALESILSDFVECDISRHVNEIMDKWNSCHPIVENGGPSNADVEDRLVKLLGSQSLATSAPRQYTDEEKKIRQAILSQYSELSDDEENAVCVSVAEGGESDLMRNTNASNVAAAAKERREYAKQESQRKKDKDKEDREKQKQLKEDKKEKRKTSKNERKR